jgi:hypothetical protein
VVEDDSLPEADEDAIGAETVVFGGCVDEKGAGRGLEPMEYRDSMGSGG